MPLQHAVAATGLIPPDDAPQAQKKRYSELLSKHLAYEVAAGLRAVGFPNVKPLPGGPGEKAFQGGLGPKRVDVAYSDERHGFILAISIKSINFHPFGKNLKNRFADLCTEAITLHLRFPYSVVCALFAFPASSHEDVTKIRINSTFHRAKHIFATISGRQEYTDPGEKFEHVAMMLFDPITETNTDPKFRLFDVITDEEMSEQQYFEKILGIYNHRNPHALIGESFEDDDEDEDLGDIT